MFFLACSWMPYFCVFTRWKKRESGGEKAFWHVLHKGTNLIMRIPPSLYHLNIIMPQRFSFQIPSHWFVKVSTYEFWRVTVLFIATLFPIFRWRNKFWKGFITHLKSPSLRMAKAYTWMQAIWRYFARFYLK